MILYSVGMKTLKMNQIGILLNNFKSLLVLEKVEYTGSISCIELRMG